MAKPRRPLGLSLAIVLSTLLYTVIPIASVIFFFSLQQHFSSIDFLENGGAVGMDFTGPQAGILIVHLVYGLIFLIIAIMAWRGKPAKIRWIFVAAVIIITIISIVIDGSTIQSVSDLDQGVDSAQSLSNTIISSRMVGSVLVALYVLWYVNRAPARAFYRRSAEALAAE